MSNLSMQVCSDDTQWQSFVESSPQGTRYCTQSIISALDCSADYWFIMRNGYPVAAIPVITSNKTGSRLPIHAYYVGMMLHREAWNCKPNRRTENLMLISEYACDHLSTHYDSFELSLHPDINDVRGFDWFNYHRPKAGRAEIYPRYTSRCHLAEAQSIRSAARGSRRREEKYATERESLQFAIDGTVDELLSLWQQSFERQQRQLPEAELSTTRQFAEHLLAQSLGLIAVCRDDGGTAHAAGLTMFDYRNTAHLPVVGTSASRYAGTLLYFSLMDQLQQKGFDTLDFNGANSPARSYFKHSIGGDTTLYFHISWTRPT